MQKSLLTLGIALAAASPLSVANAAKPLPFESLKGVKNIPNSSLLRHNKARGISLMKQGIPSIVNPVRKNAAPRIKPAPSEEAGKWMATTETMYAWDGEWILSEKNELRYSDSILLESMLTTEYVNNEIAAYYRTNNTFTEHGYVCEIIEEASENGVDFIPSVKTIRDYDPILHNVIISNEQTLWNAGESHPGNCYHRNITRDEKGNITLTEIAVLFNGIYDPTQRLIVEYGEDGKAVAIKEEVLSYDYASSSYFWETGSVIENVTWEETDGQIYDIENIFSGANKIKTGSISLDGMDLEFNVEYDGNGGYKLTATTPSLPGFTVEATFTPLDNGGYRGENYVKIGPAEIFSAVEEVEYAPNGFILREYIMEKTDGEIEIFQQSKGELFGSEEKPDSYEYSIYDAEGDEWIPNMRIEFADYSFFPTDNNSVESLPAAGVDAEYYNLQGVRIPRPAPGTICIERRGTDASKVIIR